MKSDKKSLNRSAKTEIRSASKAPVAPAKSARATKAAEAPAAPAKKPAKRSLISAAIEGVKAAVRRTTGKPKAAPAAPKPVATKSATLAKFTAPSLPPTPVHAAGKTAPVELPSILLEGDETPAPKVSGPGERFVLGPTPPVEQFSVSEELGELPEAYGTGKLRLTARDPHWLYAHWDLTTDQLRKHNRAARDGHLIVRVFSEAVKGRPLSETHVHPESRNWFLHVGRGEAKFVAELGYYAKKNGKWLSLAISRPALTPPDALSDDASVRFATIPVELSFAQMLSLLKQAVKDNVPFIEAVQQLRASGFKNLPDAVALSTSKWTPAQERAMAEILSMDSVRRVWMGSLEITELLRRQLVKDLSSISAAQFSLPSSLGVSSLSSPFGGAPGKKGFWFMVNAELIIYGATEPDAAVSIGGRKIKLRSDGTFSYRFALPDGNFNLPAIATNSAGDDTRIADLAFSRSTEYAGEVGTHPQDAALRPPKAEHVA